MNEKKEYLFSQRLQQAMEQRNITAAKLSRETNISPTAISRYLKGFYTPKSDNLNILANYLLVDPVWLSGFDTPSNSQTYNTEPSLEDYFAKDYVHDNLNCNQQPLTSLLDRMKLYPSVQKCVDPAEQASVLLTAARLILQAGYERKYMLSSADKALLANFKSLTPANQQVVVTLINSLLAQQNANLQSQNNYSQADLNYGDDIPPEPPEPTPDYCIDPNDGSIIKEEHFYE